MGFEPHEPKQQRMLRAALKGADIDVGELWLRYFGMGGAAGEYEVEAYLQGLFSLPVTQRDLLAMAANELIDERPRGYAPYSDELSPDEEVSQDEPGTAAGGPAHERPDLPDSD